MRTQREIREALTRCGDMLAADAARGESVAYSVETLEAMRVVISDALGEWHEVQQELDEGKVLKARSSMAETEQKDLVAAWEYFGDCKANLEKLRSERPLAVECSHLFFDRLRNAIVAAQEALANNAMHINDLSAQVDYWKAQAR